MHTFQIAPTTPDDVPELIDLWEASVRATHAFLSNEDVLQLRSVIERDRILEKLTLRAARSPDGAIMGFVGIEGSKIEALFIGPTWHRRGIGRQLVERAFSEFGVEDVDVNEDNRGALAFYEQLAFRVVGRSSSDQQGNPFALLHLKRTVFDP